MNKKRFAFYLMFLAICFVVFTNSAKAQDEEPITREINSSDFRKKRPKKRISTNRRRTPRKRVSSSRRKKISRISSAKRRYRHTRRKSYTRKKTSVKRTPRPPVLKKEELGVTFWRLRPLNDDEEDAPTYSVRIGNQRENWTAERVNSNTEFKRGDRVRFTIEASRSGYLYIVNREFYSDGTKGKAHIIFPTLRTRGGDNKVVAGSLIDIPNSTDSVPYFTVRPKRSNYAGEELIILITKNKLSLDMGLRAKYISTPDLQKWINAWGTTVDVYDAEDGEGVAVTQAENEAVNSRSLEQEEPLPQTIYRVNISHNKPMMVSLQMLAINSN